MIISDATCNNPFVEITSTFSITHMSLLLFQTMISWVEFIWTIFSILPMSGILKTPTSLTRLLTLKVTRTLTVSQIRLNIVLRHNFVPFYFLLQFNNFNDAIKWCRRRKLCGNWRKNSRFEQRRLSLCSFSLMLITHFVFVQRRNELAWHGDYIAFTFV